MRYLVVLAICLGTFTTSAQKKSINDVKFDLEVFRLALLSGDKAQLMQLTTPDLTYGHSSGVIENQQQFVEKLASGQSDFTKIDISEETIALYKSTAIVRHLMTAETNDNGTPGTVKLRVMLVWVEGKQGWQLAARQALKAL